MRVLVAHPQRLYGEATRAVIEAAGIEALSNFCGTEELLQAARKGDAVVLCPGFGRDMPGEVIEKIKQLGGIEIVAISSGAADDVTWFLKAGVLGFVSVDCTPTQLIDAIARVCKGEVVISGVARRDAGNGSSHAIAGPTQGNAGALKSLTPREREVLDLLSQGLSNRQIAKTLYVSEHTVRTHIQNLRSKLNVKSKFQAAVLAMQVGRLGGATTRDFIF